MSLAAANLAGASAMQANPVQPAFRAMPSNPILSEQVVMPRVDATRDTSQSDYRGEVEGDFCFTIDASDELSDASTFAAWSERDAMLSIAGQQLQTSKELLKSATKLTAFRGATSKHAKVTTKGTEALSSILSQTFDDGVLKQHGIASDSNTGQKKKKKKSSIKRTITFVVPCTCPQSDIGLLEQAAANASLGTKNCFPSSAAAVAALLTHHSTNERTVDRQRALQSTLRLSTANSSLVVFLRLYGSQEGGRDAWLDAGLVLCERSAGSKDSKNNSYARISPVSACARRIEGPLAEALSATVASLLEASGSSGGDVAAAVVMGFDDARAKLVSDTLKKALGKISSSSIVPCDGGDLASGGCLLSAAELSSSKEYIRTPDDNLTLCFQLPFADALLNCDVGLLMVASPSTTAEADAASTELVFKAQSCVPKTGMGPVRSRAPPPLIRSKDFAWGKLYFRSKTDHPPDGEYPKMIIMTRDPHGQGNSEWIPLQHVSPLLSSSKDGPVASCTASIRVDASTGGVAIHLMHGERVSAIKGRHRFYLQLAGFALLVVALVVLYYAYSWYEEVSEVRAHEQWLREFYEANAPEKLQDPDLIPRTLQKYKDRMFVLWRALERTYDVKWAPPASILESDL